MKNCLAVLISKIKMMLMLLLCTGAFIALFAFREQVLSGFSQGLRLCAEVVIPSLFPFMFLANFISLSPISELLGKVLSPVTCRLFGIKGKAAAALFLSFFSGYPVAARMAARLFDEGEIDRNEAVRFISFGVNPGPAFCVSAVGAGMLGSASAGVILLCSVLLSSLAVGIATKPRKRADLVPLQTKERGVPFSTAFCASAEFAAKSVGIICAYTLLFSAAAAVLFYLPAYEIWARPLMPALEITSGLARLGNLPLPIFAAFIAFGGLSVQFQLCFMAGNIGIGFGRIFRQRLICAMLAALFCLLLLLLFPVKLPELGAMSYAVRGTSHSFLASFGLGATVFVFLGYIGQLFSEKIQKI